MHRLALVAVALAGLGVHGFAQVHQRAPAGEEGGEKADTAAVAPAPPEVPSLDSLGGPGEEGVLQRLRDQILQNPVVLDQDWLTGFCRYVPNIDSLERYLDRVEVAGAQWDSTHAQLVRADEKTGPQSPRFFLAKAKSVLLTKKVSAKRVKGRGQGYVELALHRAYQRGHQDWGKVDPSFMKEFFKVNSLLRQLLQEVTADTSAEKEALRIENFRAREAALVDAHLRLVEHQRRLAELGVDEGAPAAGEKEELKPREELDALIRRVDTQPWKTKWETPRGPGSRPTAYAEFLKKSIDDNLLALSHIYTEAMAAETSSQERQEEWAGQAFKALSMVYLRTNSADALHKLREVERIQQDFMRQRARANWNSAKAAAEAGKDELAGEYYFQATHDFLQCLARLQDQERQAVADEFLQMRADIAAWNAVRSRPAAAGKK